MYINCGVFIVLSGGVRSKTVEELLYARQKVVTLAKAFGVDAIDIVDTNFKGGLDHSLKKNYCIAESFHC